MNNEMRANLPATMANNATTNTANTLKFIITWSFLREPYSIDKLHTLNIIALSFTSTTYLYPATKA